MPVLQVMGLGMAALDILARTASEGLGPMGAPLAGLAVDGGGMACNAMAAAQRLGLTAGMVGTFGSDRLGRLKLQTLEESGVDGSRMVRRAEPDDQVVLVHIDAASGERRFHPLAAPWRRLLAPDELDRDYLTQAEILLVDGFHLEASLRAAAWMRMAGKRVMLDANVTHGPPSPGLCQLVGFVDYLVCGAGFCQALTGKDDLATAARRALELGPRVVVQTHGSAGSDTFTSSDAFHTPAFAVKVVDTSGAGDVFHGAFLAGLLRDWDLRRAVLFSSAAAALKCTQLGRDGYPTFEQVERFLEKGVVAGHDGERSSP